MPKLSSNDLLQSLRTTLDQAKAPAPVVPHQYVQSPTEAAALARRADSRVKKISISVYPKDIEVLDSLKGYLAEQGIRNLSDSETMRIAWRTLILTPRCVEVYQEMKKEDGRRK
jgi:hypothetical protein